MAPRLFVISPCYNEEAVLPETAERLKKKLHALIGAGTVDARSRVLFVNDGSTDRTWEIIRALHEEDALFQGLCLSCNRGHQNALYAGLMTVRTICDVSISMDADLQDDIDVIDRMLEQYAEGKDVVYGVRSSRKKDSILKRSTAQGFYKTMRAMGAKTVYNHADCRLMSKRAMEALSTFHEVNLFLRGLVPMVGFPSGVVYYERAARFAGESKYPVRKMTHFAVEGITSLSVAPIRMITKLGFFILLVALAVAVYSLIRFFRGQTVPGWTTTVLSVWAIGALIMISLGVIGEYIGKIYLEAKQRPRYVIESYLRDGEDEVVLTDPAVQTPDIG